MRIPSIITINVLLFLCVLGAFLIPYFIMLTFVGIPVFLIELSMGQYGAAGPMTVWEASPMFHGTIYPRDNEQSDKVLPYCIFI